MRNDEELDELRSIKAACWTAAGVLMAMLLCSVGFAVLLFGRR